MIEATILQNFFQYWFGQTVYLVTDKDQLPRLVIEISVKPSGCVYYGIINGTESSYHYDFELTSEINFKLKTEN